MKMSEIELPSNKKFGFFFTLVFIVTAGYFFFFKSIILAYVFSILAVAFFLTTLIRANSLLPLNKLWMRAGFLIGMIVSPVVLSLIFFLMFMPLALIMRISGRDELRLKFTKKKTHWIARESQIKAESFKNQF